jgi:polyisoprenoid-binding protein YceI
MQEQTHSPAEVELKPAAPRRRRSRKRIVFAAAAVVIAAGLGGAWWLGLFTPEPDPVSLEDAIADAAPAQTAGEVTTTAASAATASTTPAAESETATSVAAGLSSLEGAWTITPSDATFVGYRANSQTGEAVGRSPGVTGSLTATATQITEVAVTADMTQLTSDSSLRDQHLGDEGLQHNTYPTSTFVLTEPIDIPDIPAEGEQLAFSATGELTVRDIALPVVVNLDAAVVDSQLIVVGSTEISLDDYGASIGNTTTATMEFSLVFKK